MRWPRLGARDLLMIVAGSATAQAANRALSREEGGPPPRHERSAGVDPGPTPAGLAPDGASASNHWPSLSCWWRSPTWFSWLPIGFPVGAVGMTSPLLMTRKSSAGRVW